MNNIFLILLFFFSISQLQNIEKHYILVWNKFIIFLTILIFYRIIDINLTLLLSRIRNLPHAVYDDADVTGQFPASLEILRSFVCHVLMEIVDYERKNTGHFVNNKKRPTFYIVKQIFFEYKYFSYHYHL